MKTFDDLLPKFFIDYFNQSTTRDYQVVKLEEIQNRFCHNGQTIDGRPCKAKR